MSIEHRFFGEAGRQRLSAKELASLGREVWVGPDVKISRPMLLEPGPKNRVALSVMRHNLPPWQIQTYGLLRESTKSRVAQVAGEAQSGIGRKLQRMLFRGGYAEFPESLEMDITVANHGFLPISLPENGLFRFYCIGEDAFMSEEEVRSSLGKSILLGGQKGEDWRVVEDGSIFFRVNPHRLWIPKDGPWEAIVIDHDSPNTLGFRTEHIDRYLEPLPRGIEGNVFSVGETIDEIVLQDDVYGEIDENVYIQEGNLFIPRNRHSRSRLLIPDPQYKWPIRVETLSTEEQARQHWIRIRFAKKVV